MHQGLNFKYNQSRIDICFILSLIEHDCYDKHYQFILNKFSIYKIRDVIIMAHINAVGITDVGLKRENNEDAFVVDTERQFYMVSDGMGGAAAGELASKILVETAVDVFSHINSPSEKKVIQTVQKSFYEANNKILAHVEDTPEHKGMGCTGELLSFHDSGFIIGHIGDSRTYRFRGLLLQQLTRDHSLVQDQVDQGMITLEEARSHPYRNVISRAVGTQKDLALDLLRGKMAAGDLFLLCSDGLTDMLEDANISRILSKQGSLNEKAEKLIESAKQAGGNDNITLILAEIL